MKNKIHAVKKTTASLANVDTLLSVERTLNTICINQKEIIRTLLLALLCKEHVLLIGPPGNNKTRMIDGLCRLIGLSQHKDNCGKYEFFRTTLDKFSGPEALLGPWSIAELENKRWSRELSGTLATADFAFIGEFFSATGAALRSLVRILNERSIENNGEEIKCPLHTLFADTNVVPRENCKAVFDRFLFRVYMMYLSENDKQDFTDMLQVGNKRIAKSLISIEDIKKACINVTKINVPASVYSELFSLRTALLAGSPSIQVSDRRWVKAIKVLKASAYLRKSDSVDFCDFQNLANVLWTCPEEIANIKKQLDTYTNTSEASTDEARLAAATKIYEDAISSGDEEVKLSACITLADLCAESFGKEIREKIQGMSQTLTNHVITATTATGN